MEGNRTKLSREALKTVIGGIYSMNVNRCVLCGECIMVCPAQCIIISRGGKYVIDEKRCINCGQCRLVCPVDALKSRLAY